MVTARSTSPEREGLSARHSNMALPVISAILFVLIFPITAVDFSLWPLVFVCLVPLVRVCDSPLTLGWKAFGGFIWGALIAIGIAYWLFYAMVWQYGTTVLTAVVFMILCLMLPHGLLYSALVSIYSIVRGRSLLSYALVLPSLWVMTDLAREAIPILVPWASIGYGLQPWNAYLQAADLGGVYGLSFLAVMANGCIAWLSRTGGWGDIMQWLKTRRTAHAGSFIAENRAGIIILLLILILPPIYGTLRRAQVRRDTARRIAAGEGVTVTAVQPNFSQRERWSAGGIIDRVERCLAMSAKEGIVVWPETVVNAPSLARAEAFRYIRKRAPGPLLIVAGGVRPSRKRDGVYNTAYLIQKNGQVLWYDKNILLPYAETAPFGDILGEYYNAPTEFLVGRTPSAARTGAGVTGISICFEVLYPSHAREAVRRGAGMLINISNDGWFGATSMPILHLRQASVRAVENRRFMVRSSNNGYSAIITPTGEVAARARLFARQSVSAKAAMLEAESLWLFAGDWVIYLSALVSLASLCAALFRKEE